jgi:nitrite reductase/ring-hydroxylating ferredoxin subunit/uncharacterized membrane protein
MQSESIIRAIETQEWLEPAEKALKEGLDAAFEEDASHGKPVENALHGVWLGHTLHPALTDIPLGAWTVAFVLDLVEESTGARKYRAGADAALNIGLAGAAAAAVTGLADWKDISKEARRAGLVHGLLNTAATGLFLTSAIRRANGKRGSARAFSYAAFGIAIASAWLGGHLVYANQIGVGRTAGKRPPADFVPVLPVIQLEEDKPHPAEYQGYSLVLVKKGEKIYALADTCTHLGGPLSEGTVEGECIRCPWHGSAFSLETGEVVESPAVRPEVVFDARVQNGHVEVRARKDAGVATGPASASKP